MGVEIQMQVQNRGTMGIIDGENHRRNGAYPREGKVPLMRRRKGAARAAQWLQGDDESGLEIDQGAREGYLSDDTPAWSEVSRPIARVADGRKRCKGEGF